MGPGGRSPSGQWRADGATVGKREFETDGRDAPGLIAFPRGGGGVVLRVSPALRRRGWGLGGSGFSPWIPLIQSGMGELLLLELSECLFYDSSLFHKKNLSFLHIHVAM